MDANKLSSISQADADEKIGEFWDTHDFTDFDNPDMPDVQFEITCAVPVEVELFTAIESKTMKSSRVVVPYHNPGTSARRSGG